MRRLMLLRHAKSDWSAPGAPDRERPLNRRGQETAPKVGAYMAHHGLIPDRVLCSTADRARETWEHIAAELSAKPAIVYEERLYQAQPEAILDVLREVDNRIRSLLIIGHNPGLQELASLLIASGDVEHRERLTEKFPTAGLAVIDFALNRWDKLHLHSGRLERFVIPRAIAAASD